MCSAALTRHTLARIPSFRGRAQRLCTKEVPQLRPRIQTRWSQQRLVTCSPELPRSSPRPRPEHRRSGSSPNPSRLDHHPLSITVRSTVVPRSSAPATLRQVRMGANPARPSYAFGGGCLAFTDDLHRVTWPRKFRPGITFKYDGTTNPREFVVTQHTTACVVCKSLT
jgi:hypothetical protein